jgi:hypothetical protein
MSKFVDESSGAGIVIKTREGASYDAADGEAHAKAMKRRKGSAAKAAAAKMRASQADMSRGNIANFKGKQAAPFGKGKGRKKKVAAAKAAAAQMRAGSGTQSYSNTLDNARLSAAARKRLPKSAFAGPGDSYPVPDRSHAIFAKAQATRAYKKGRMSKGQRDAIVRAANRKLGKSGKA